MEGRKPISYPAIVIGQHGTWEEFSALAERIADFAHIPLKLGPLP